MQPIQPFTVFQWESSHKLRIDVNFKAEVQSHISDDKTHAGKTF